ncbi:unnamed protein product [Sphenostylis stenocarpa]|uniref:Receptor ligand binding region domain-containing protein n=1 Tax=Sphenostylis stenocarpa TaxID=92480 RepID=A0AA86VYT1_9FABA|nr:unnamed protein product [Sphenostylis stenocarpa]
MACSCWVLESSLVLWGFFSVFFRNTNELKRFFSQMEVMWVTSHARNFVGRALFLLVLFLWIPSQVVVGRTRTTITNSTTSSTPRVLRVGALFTVNSIIGRSAKPAIIAAFEDVNADSSVLPGIKLEVSLHDTNCSGFAGTMEGNCQNLNL